MATPAEIFALTDFDELVRPLLGTKVSLPWKGYGSAIFLELGELQPLRPRERHRQGMACLSIEYDWRLERGDRIVCGSGNRRPLIATSLLDLQDAIVESVALIGQVPELVVHFSSGHCLRSMAMEAMDPQWSIRVSAERYVGILDGLLVVGNVVEGMSDEDIEESTRNDKAAERWGTPVAEPKGGSCEKCVWWVALNGDGSLLNYGLCRHSESPFDGRVVNVQSGCPAFDQDLDLATDATA